MNINHRDQWFGGRTYAQHGDDLAVLNIFKRLGIEHPNYLDLGAHHPFDLSNTALLYERGSRGVNVEANPVLFEVFKEFRMYDVNVCAAVGVKADRAAFYRISDSHGCNSLIPMDRAKLRPIEVEVLTLQSILEQYCDSTWPDFLTIDIEGMDVPVLGSIDFGSEPPKVVCAEAVSQIGDVTDELRQLMTGKAYDVHSWCGSNMLFVRRELLGALR